MNIHDIPQLRLINQQITQTKFKKPEEIVKYLGAVQSQDFSGAKWAIGLRLPNSLDKEVEKAFNEAKILRTHALRPTWHFVAPEDLKWITTLNAPQVKRIMSYYYKKLGLITDVIKKSNLIIEKSLRGKNYLTRTEIAKVLDENGVKASGQKLGHIVGEAELDTIICSGPRRGKQFTYALVEEVTPKVKDISREEALSKLAKIFFDSRGPATIKDFSKWSGLTQADCKRGLETVKSKFKSEIIDGKEYWFSSNSPSAISHQPLALLLPNYDEYISSYADYTVISDPETRSNLEKIGNALFWNHMVLNGKIVGSWRRVFKPKFIEIQFAPLVSLNKEEKAAFEESAEKFGDFFGSKVKLTDL